MISVFMQRQDRPGVLVVLIVVVVVVVADVGVVAVGVVVVAVGSGVVFTSLTAQQTTTQ